MTRAAEVPADVRKRIYASGQRVEEGTPIYIIATEKAEHEVEAGASGTVVWTAQAGVGYDIGVEIGVIKAQPGDRPEVGVPPLAGES